MAWPAEANKLALVTCAAVVLQKRIINPAAASMIIMIMEGTCTAPDAFTEKPGLNPSLPENTGNRVGKDPINTTPITASAKMATELVAPGLTSELFHLHPHQDFLQTPGLSFFLKTPGQHSILFLFSTQIKFLQLHLLL